MKRDEVSSEYKIDLSQLYKDIKEFEYDCERVINCIKGIEKHKGRVVSSARNLYDVLELVFNTDVMLGRINVYSTLLTQIDAGDVDGKNAYAKAKDVITVFTTTTAFVDEELLKCDWAVIEKYIDELKDLDVYRFYLYSVFKQKDHILSEKEEIIMAEMDSLAGELENNRSIFYFEDLKFGKVKDSNGNYVEVTNQNFKKLLESPDKAFRRRVFEKYSQAFGSFENTFTALLNSKLKYDVNYARIRKYESPLDLSLSIFDLDKKVLDNFSLVADENKGLCRKYNNILKKVLKLNKLHSYDMFFSPFPKSDRSYTVEEANDMMHKSFSIYGEKYQEYLKKLFDSKKVDYLPTDNKATGAFCIDGYDVSSFVFLNYHNRINNISTLAHEIGHAIHAMLINDNNKSVNASSSHLLVEIASITNEILFCDYVLKNSSDPYEKYELLKSLLDTLLGNFFLTAGRLEVQNRMYEKILDGEALTADYVNEIELNAASKFDGNGRQLLDKDKYLWMRVSHYYYLYYNYQYAIGVSIATLFASRILSGKKEEIDNYLEFLKASGRKFPTDTLKDYGVDLLDKAVFDDYFKYTNEKLKEFENIVKEVGVGVNE